MNWSYTMIIYLTVSHNNICSLLKSRSISVAIVQICKSRTFFSNSYLHSLPCCTPWSWMGPDVSTLRAISCELALIYLRLILIQDVVLNLIYNYLLFLSWLILNNMKLLFVFLHLLLFILFWIFILLIFSLSQIRVYNIFVRPFPGDVWVGLPRHDNIITNQETCFIHVRICSVLCLILDNYSTLCRIETWPFIERNRCFSCWVRLWLIVIVLTVFFYPETGVDMIFLK